MKLASRLFSLVFALLVAACGGGDDTPLPTAVEVKAAYDAAPPVLQSWYAQPASARGDVVMTQYRPDFTLTQPFRLVVSYQNRTIYDERRWFITDRHAIMSDGTDVLLVTAYDEPSVSISGTSVVFINGEKLAKLQSLPVRITGQDRSAAVRDIREWRDGWLLIYASYSAQQGLIGRWAMYHPKTGEFVDCGEFGSSRWPDWGPSAPDICLYR